MALNINTEAAAMEACQPKEEQIPPEMLVVIAAAITAFLDTNLRIRSVRLLQSPNAAVSRWSRQGRASVLASHNLRSKR